jgi:hypothetical protein
LGSSYSDEQYFSDFRDAGWFADFVLDFPDWMRGILSPITGQVMSSDRHSYD